MNKFLLLLLLAFASCNDGLDSLIFQQFQRFIKKYNKKYDSMNEYLARYEVFKRNCIENFSVERKTYKTGITKFSDLTKQEFFKIFLTLNYNAMAMANFEPTYITPSNAAPTSWDWRDYGVIADKDQGNCGSCWAFTTTGNLEFLYYREKHVFRTFSEQMLVDCDTLDSGCNGGLMEYALNWIKKNGGIMYDADYPYTGVKGTCKSDKSKYADFEVTRYLKLGSSTSTWSPVDEDEIKEFLYMTGPLAIALNATPLQNYVSGILDVNSSQCPVSGINHAVLLVGYGVDATTGMNYWIIRNTWGKNWGENGYFRIRRGNGTCGVNCYIITAVIALK